MNDRIARFIDHSLLHPTLTDDDIRVGCDVALRYGVASVCVKPYAVKQAAEALTGTTVAVGTVIGFPHGSHTTAAKVFETEEACRDGATEVDMVVNVGKVLQGDWDYVRQDIQAVVTAAHQRKAIVKVIFETDYLQEDAAIVKLCEICESVGADFVKTSTGFGFVTQPEGNYNYRGATAHHVALMRKTCGPQVGVKASGGIRNYEDAQRMRTLGSMRLGTSATETIVSGEPSHQAGY